MTTNIEAPLDIRDIPMGSEYWVVCGPNGRALRHAGFPMYRAAWMDASEAKTAAKSLGDGYSAVKTSKD